MPIYSRIVGVVRSLAGRGAVDRDLDADVGACFDMLVDEKTAAGMTPDEARRQAQIEIGGVEQLKEAVREARPAAWLDALVRDTRYSLRLLRGTPAFSATAVLVLALGIGANTAVFSVIDMLCFRPLPGSEQPGEAVSVYARDADDPDSYRPFSYAEFEAVRDETKVFSHVMAQTPVRVGVAEGDTLRRTKAAVATGDYFATLGVRLAAGRSFTREEERPGSRAAVMVLSHTYWQQLGSPRDILGATLVVNSYPFTVVGIAPAGFAGQMALAGPHFWMPIGAAALLDGPSGGPAVATSPGNRAQPRLMVVGRLKPGVTLDAANAALVLPSGTLGRASDGKRYCVNVGSLSRLNQGVRPQDGDPALVAALGAVEGAALIVLIIASLNVANMQLARGTARRKEIAMRLALGASRRRIVAQLMTEGLTLAVGGGVVGALASAWALHALVASVTLVVPEAISADLTPDWRIMLASLACCTLSALAFGLGPAWTLSRLDLLPEMKSQEGSGVRRGPRAFGTRNLLVAGQIALSLALLAASGLFVRGAISAASAEPGYSFDQQLLVRLDATAGGLDQPAGQRAFARLIERIRATPGVAAAAPASHLAFSNESQTRRVWRPGTGRDGDRGERLSVTALSFEVGTTYFRTLGLPVLRGREFTPAEEVDSTDRAVALIDEPLASALFAGIDPVGQYVAFTTDNSGIGGAPVQVVGLVPGVRHRLGDTRPVPHIYLPLGSRYRAFLNIHVRRARGGEQDDAVRAALRDTIRRADTKLAVLGVQSLDEARDAMPTNWLVRTAASTFGAFGVIALFMATIGLYGVKAYLVARRTREIGIRMAIGAGTGDVLRMILKEGALLLGASIGLGFLLALGVGQAVSSFLVGVRPFDPLVLLVATLVLSTAVLAACYLPARRATRISPMTALRVE